MDIVNLLGKTLTTPSTEGEEGAAPNFSIWTYFMIAYPFFMSVGLGGGFMYIVTRIIKYYWDKFQANLYCYIKIDGGD
jgi:hypothetical protein